MGLSVRAWLRRLPVAAYLLAIPAAVIAQPVRIAGAIDSAQTIRLPGVVHPLVQARFDRGPVEPSFHLSSMQMMLAPSAAQQSELDQLLAAQQNPASPLYRQWLTPEQYAARFGTSPADLAKITQWLSAAGFQIDYKARGRDRVVFSGTAAQVEAAFHATVHRYEVRGEMHFAISSDPLIPAALGPLVSGLLGLNDFLLRPIVSARGYASSNSTQAATQSSGTLTPAALAAIYDIQPLYQEGIDATGIKIAIIGLTDPYFDDVQTFRGNQGLKPAQIQSVLGGEDPGFAAPYLIEADLDLEWAGAIAPGAQLLYVYATNPDTASFYAVDQNLAPVLSESLGICEANVPAGDSAAYEAEAKRANAQGITWVVATGDFGAAICDETGATAVATLGPSVSFPSSVPEITAVGGTEFNEQGANYWTSSGSPAGYIPETAWNDGVDGEALSIILAAGGGGVSTLYAKPSWQSGPGVPPDGQRDLPDLALSASPFHDRYGIILGGQQVFTGGTSASVQVFAGMVAVLNQAEKSGGLGNINPALYSLAVSSPAAFHDITAGSNIVPCQAGSPGCVNGQFGYSAGPGFDLATGLGSLDLYNLATLWAGPSASSTQPMLTTLSPSSVTAGSGAVTLTVNGSNLPSTAMVQWNGTPLATTFVSSTQLTATVSASLIAAPLTAAITVSSGSATTGPLYFTATPAPVAVGNQILVGALPSAPNAPSCSAAGATYLTPSMSVQLRFTVLNPNQTFSTVWTAADGTVYLTLGVVIGSAGNGSYCASVEGPSLSDLPPSQLGAWTVKLVGNGAPLFSLNFSVQCTTGVPAISSIRSAGAFGAYPYFASGSWLEIMGTELGDPADPRITSTSNSGQWTAADFTGANAPTSLDGISVTINGRQAFVSYISPGQINVQAPQDTATGNVNVTVTTCRATSPPFSFPKQALAPGLLAPSSFLVNGTQYMAATFVSDGAYVLSPTAAAATGIANSRPAKPGDQIVAYGIGFGNVAPIIPPGTIASQSNTLTNPVTFSFGSAPAQVAYAGLAPNLVGLYEFYITVPAGLASGDYQMHATQAGTPVPQTLFLTVVGQ